MMEEDRDVGTGGQRDHGAHFLANYAKVPPSKSKNAPSKSII